MRGVSRAAALALVLQVAGCARMGEPPGGPPDVAPPALVSTYPDSLEVMNNFKGDVEFRFDEVVSEGASPNFGLGSGDLEKLVILSPTEKVPSVHWKRRRITVHPAEGWRPNRVYRVELLPGIVDLRNNRSKNGRIITFTTGAPIPTRFIRGRVVDWTTGRPEPQGLVEAVLLPDTLKYRTSADSTGRFALGPLPDGDFLVYGVLDANKNRRREPREPFDSVRLAAGRDSTGELWAFRHDTVAARISGITLNDSMSVLVTFGQALDPYQRLPHDSARVRLLPDSIDVTVDSVMTKPQYDSTFAAKPDSSKADSLKADSAGRPRRDSVRVAPRDTARAQPGPPRVIRRRDRLRPQQLADTADRGPLKTKPILSDKLVIRLRGRLVPGSRYVVELKGLRNVSGIAGHAILGLVVPEEKKPPPDSTKADSTKADSSKARARADTTKRPPPAKPPARRPDE